MMPKLRWYIGEEDISGKYRRNFDMTPKSANRSNITQLRPIDFFWTNLIQKLYFNNFVAKSEVELIKIEGRSLSMPAGMSSYAIAKIPDNLRQAARKDVVSFK